ncbi:MAG: hypothetical protein QXX64_06370 [Nitrososphaera sp.]|nr:hypothetical protein [Candidatus Nitrososphaera gargensis]
MSSATACGSAVASAVVVVPPVSELEAAKNTPETRAAAMTTMTNPI